MKNKTIQLLDKMKNVEYMDERLDILKNSFKDETAYIIAAGPSLNDYPVNKLKEKLKDELVFCIKQSYHTYKDICDFLLLNFCNLSPYNFDEKTIVSWCYWFQNHPEVITQNKWKADLLFPIYRNGDDWKEKGFKDKLAQSVCEQGDFENLSLEKSIERPWGPSLMLEIAIPMAMHLGVKKIVTVGWDIGDMSAYKEKDAVFIDHYYSDNTHLYDKFHMTRRELQLMIDSSEKLYEWVTSKGIEFNIASPTNPASDVIPRVEIL